MRAPSGRTPRRARKVFADGTSFEGHFIDGNFEGHGAIYMADGTEFEGLWHANRIKGPGRVRLADGTVLSGLFEDGGASGEGKKTWANGCVYTGLLSKNCIGKYGSLQWPDGRCYIGAFEENRLHGEGTLVWSDGDGVCTYRGWFENNVFEGQGKLTWASGARYEGMFRNGQYHGEGTFKWPQGSGSYRGSWANGEMSGRGTFKFTPDDGQHAYVYVGTFKHGEMEGSGTVTFRRAGGGMDSYKGDVRASRFSGRGAFTWQDGAQLEGLFEDGYCNRVGRKVYPDGSMYTGELRFDLEHGKGILSEPGGRSYVAIWVDGKMVKELLGSCAPEFDLVDMPDTSALPDPPSVGGQTGHAFGTRHFRPASDDQLPRLGVHPSTPIFSSEHLQLPLQKAPLLEAAEDEGSEEDGLGGNSSSTTLNQPTSSDNIFQSSASTLRPGAKRKALLPVMDEEGVLVDGKALVVFLNGDRYVGCMRGGRKHGSGMYVYADFVAYRGVWEEDILDGVRHPVNEDCMPIEVRRIGPPIPMLPPLKSRGYSSQSSEPAMRDDSRDGLKFALEDAAHDIFCRAISSRGV